MPVGRTEGRNVRRRWPAPPTSNVTRRRPRPPSASPAVIGRQAAARPKAANMMSAILSDISATGSWTSVLIR